MQLLGRSCRCWRATLHALVRTWPAQPHPCPQPWPRPWLTCCHPAGALAWNADQLSSGSRDRMILQRDIRTPPLQSERRLQGHRQEVCGLKWSTDHQLLASGGNDNKVWLLSLLPCPGRPRQNLRLPRRGCTGHGPGVILEHLAWACSWVGRCHSLGLPAAARVEPLNRKPCAAVHGAPGSREGHCLVPTPAWTAGIWGWHS